MSDDQEQWPEVHHPDAEALEAQRRRNVWLGLALGAFVVVVGAVTAMRFIENWSASGAI